MCFKLCLVFQRFEKMTNFTTEWIGHSWSRHKTHCKLDRFEQWGKLVYINETGQAYKNLCKFTPKNYRAPEMIRLTDLNVLTCYFIDI